MLFAFLPFFSHAASMPLAVPIGLGVGIGSLVAIMVFYTCMRWRLLRWLTPMQAQGVENEHERVRKNMETKYPKDPNAQFSTMEELIRNRSALNGVSTPYQTPAPYQTPEPEVPPPSYPAGQIEPFDDPPD
jgi:hypothetical protein